MITATDTRKNARESLNGKWSKAVGITFIYTITLSFFEFILILKNFSSDFTLNLIVTLCLLAITPPLMLGLTFTFMKLKRGEEVGYLDFFNLGFSNFKKSWAIYFRIILKVLISLIPIIIIAIITIMIQSINIQNSTDTLYMSNLSVFAYIPTLMFFFIITYIVMVIVSLSFALSFNIAYDEPSLTGKEIVDKSKELMKGNKGNLFLLILSFIGLAILCFCTLGIGFFWLIPYMSMSFVCFYDELINK